MGEELGLRDLRQHALTERAATPYAAGPAGEEHPLAEHREGLKGFLTSNCFLFDSALMAEMNSRYPDLLVAAAADRGRRLLDLPLGGEPGRGLASASGDEADELRFADIGSA